MDFSFFKIKIDKIKIGLKSLLHIDTKVETHKTEIDARQIHEHKEQNYDFSKNLNVVITNSDNEHLQKSIESLGFNLPLLASSTATGEATLPEPKTETESKTFLKSWLKEHQQNPSFLLDTGRLLFIYKERETIDFTKEELVFLVQSSIKKGFPVWYWSFLYREKFGNVVPLFKSVYEISDKKIRIGVVQTLVQFSDTAESIFELSQKENNALVLGHIVVELHKKAWDAHAQRVITNAISRRIIPELDYQDVKSLSAELGKNEVKFLYEAIETGWSNERINSLNILSLTASDSDLPLLEGMIRTEMYRDALQNAMHCIARIGKTNINELLRKELENARNEEWFLQTLYTLVAVKDKNILPKLLSWLKDSSSFAWRFSSELHEYSLNQKIEESIIVLLDKDFYEVIVKDILSYEKNENRHLYVWRQFGLLEEIRDKELIEIIKIDDRLKLFPEEQQKLIKKLTTDEAINTKDKKTLLSLSTPSDYRNAMIALRELWKIIPQEEALDHQNTIEDFRKDLNQRLETFANGDFPEEVKNLSKQGLDYFLGENELLYKYGDDGFDQKEMKKIQDFSTLLQDISLFDKIEGEFISFVFKTKDEKTKPFLLSNIGRPFRVIYDSISKDWPSLMPEEIKDSLIGIIKNHKNPLIRLAAIGAARTLNILEEKLARILIIRILSEARKELKAKDRRKKDVDQWLIHHITYFRAIGGLAEIGNIDDISFIDESINSETTLYRTFNQYGSFYDVESIKILLEIIEATKNEKEIENATSTLDTLDYFWSKKVLNIQA